MTTQPQPSDIDTIKGYTDTALDRVYAKTAGPMLRSIYDVTNAPGSAMQRSLTKLDEEAEELDEKGEMMLPDNAQLEQTERAYLNSLLAAQTLIEANDNVIQNTVSVLAIQAVTAKVFSVIAGQIAAGGRNPVTVSITIFEKALSAAGISWVFPSAVDITADYVQSAAWIAKMERWGEGYAALTHQYLLEGARQGWGPIATARYMRETAQNIPVHAAENLTRTLQLTAYRESSAAMEGVNGDFIEAKIRIAKLDDKTCFPKDTMIDCIDGKKPIQEVHPGDRVLTHTGKYQYVYKTIKRPHEGGMITFRTKGGKAVTCTEDHPILIRRRKKNKWLFAKDIQLGDIVFVASRDGSNNLYHLIRNFAIKWSTRNANNDKTSFDKIGVLSNIGLWSLVVPVGSINLYGGINFLKEKINRIFANFLFLLKRLIDFIKTKTKVLFRLGLAPVGMIAGSRAVFPGMLFAIIMTSLYPESLPAFSAFDIYSLVLRFCLTFFIAKICTATAYSALLYIKSIFTGFACNANAPRKFDFGAFIRTKFCNSPAVFFQRISVKNLFACGAFSFVSVLSKVRAFVFEIAKMGAKFSINLTSLVFNSAILANVFSHDVIVSLTTRAVKLNVYNLEVENDHTYIANGIVVHNCMACVSLHGSPLAVGEAPSDHYRGRCDSWYRLKGGPEWPDMMQADSIPGQRNFVSFQSGEDWFNSLPTERQEQQVSFLNNQAKLRAFRDGVPLSEFVGDYDDSVFGHQFVEDSLKGALGDDAEQYYAKAQKAEAEA